MGRGQIKEIVGLYQMVVHAAEQIKYRSGKGWQNTSLQFKNRAGSGCQDLREGEMGSNCLMGTEF